MDLVTMLVVDVNGHKWWMLFQKWKGPVPRLAHSQKCNCRKPVVVPNPATCWTIECWCTPMNKVISARSARRNPLRISFFTRQNAQYHQHKRLTAVLACCSNNMVGVNVVDAVLCSIKSLHRQT